MTIGHPDMASQQGIMTWLHKRAGRHMRAGRQARAKGQGVTTGQGIRSGHDNKAPNRASQQGIPAGLGQQPGITTGHQNVALHAKWQVCKTR